MLAPKDAPAVSPTSKSIRMPTATLSAPFHSKVAIASKRSGWIAEASFRRDDCQKNATMGTPVKPRFLAPVVSNHPSGSIFLYYFILFCFSSNGWYWHAFASGWDARN